MTESRPWGAAKEKPKEEEGRAQHTPARSNIVALLRARPAKIPFCASPVMREARVRGSPEMAPP